MNKFLGLIGNLFTSQRAVFKKFADTYDLVYFGRMHLADEDERMVHGITVSTQHQDDHYCIGTIHGYDVIMLERTDTLKLPNTSKSEHYRWVIMQIDLKSRADHPHVFLDGGHHNEIFYQHLFIKFARLMKVDKALFAGSDKLFNDRFTVYTPPDVVDDLPMTITPDIAATMAHHFAHLDFEWFQDRLIVYSTGRMPTVHLLDHMLRAGHWLATELDKNKTGLHQVVQPDDTIQPV